MPTRRVTVTKAMVLVYLDELRTMTGILRGLPVGNNCPGEDTAEDAVLQALERSYITIRVFGPESVEVEVDDAR